jgi:subtilisin family serine protease
MDNEQKDMVDFWSKWLKIVPLILFIITGLTMLAFYYHPYRSLPKSKPQEFAKYQIDEPKTDKWIAFHKHKFKKQKGDKTIEAKYFQMATLNADQVEPIDGINGFSFVAKHGEDFSKHSDENWTIQKVQYYHVYETLYRLTPVDSNCQSPPQPVPTPTPPPTPNPVPTPTPNPSPIQETTWGQKAMHVSQGIDASNILIEDIDTGLDQSIMDQFPAGMLVPGVSRVAGQPVNIDGSGHGSHTAGIIGSTRFGHAHVKIKPCKGLNNQGSGDSLSLGGCINDAAQSHAQIVSASWGMDQGSDPYIGAQIDAYVAQGGIFVAAAGNSSGGPIGFPGNKPNVWTVTSMDESMHMSFFSSRGVKIGGKMGIAPGSNIPSTWPIPLGGPVKILNGTSMATPAAAATFAIMLAKGKSLTGFVNLGLTQDQQGMGQYDIGETVK